MNRIFRILWSQALNAWVVVSELATSRGKSGGGLDKRGRAQVLMLDRDQVGGSPPVRSWPLQLAVFAALLSLYAPAQAANRFWDVNGTAVGRGGTGIWNTTSPFWSPNGDGVSGPYSAWNNAALDDAFFGGTAGAVTLGVPISVHNLTFETDGYTITGNTLTLGGVTPTITTNAGVNASISSVVAGSAGLTKAGTGGLSLTGVNTFSGTINVNAGTLTVNGDASLGNAGNGIVMANGSALSSVAALSASRVVTLTSGSIAIRNAGVGAVRYTGAGGLNVGNGIALTNNANDYTGQTVVGVNATFSFSSIANVGGGASALGAPTTMANGTIVLNPSDSGINAVYTGSGSSSDRNWQVFSRFFGSSGITNSGTGTLTLTGNIFGQYQNGTFSARGTFFSAQSADLVLSGVISGGQPVFTLNGGGTNRTITLGGANTYTATTTNISNVTVSASTLANTGVASSLGTSGAVGITNGVLSYTGAGASSNRAWGLNNGTINSDGTGALSLSGTLGLTNTGTLGGSFVGADNLFSGVISGAGGLAKSGASTWVVNGINTYTGNTTVNGGILRAGSTTAFGATNGAVVNGGTLDLNDLNFTLPSLAGTGGIVDLGSGTLILNALAATNTSYAGNITGSGGLTKEGASTQTLTGTNTYTGTTTVNGGTLRLDFAGAGGPASNIISSASTLTMGGGTLNAVGAAGEANTQTFNGLNVVAGNNTIGATSGAGGSMTVNLGAITRTGGLINFNLPGSGNITTTNTLLGGWATVNGTDYAKVVGGNILAFTDADYTDKDDASTWLTGEFISDSDADADSFFGTVGSNTQLGGLQFTTPDATTTVTVAAGQTLGIDGTIIVAPSVGANNQTITGGSLTGMAGGGTLGIQQNGTGNFTIASQIVDNGGSIGFTKAGTGLVTLSNASNNYTGGTSVSQGILSVNSIANGGAASSIGASSAASSNLVLEGSTLRYTGGTTSSDRGFTLAKSGAILGGGIEVTNAAANLSFSGQVTSADGANFTKTGPGTLTLSNAGNDYTGITRVDGGTLSVTTLANGGLVSSIGASSNASGNLVLNSGTLQYTGGTTSTDRGFTVGNLAAGGGSGGINVSNAATTLTVSGTAVGDDGLRKEGPGSLVLSGTNTYTGGTAVNAGTLRAGSTQAFGHINNNLSVASGATADLNGFNTSIGALLGSGNVTLGSATLTSTTANGTFSGVISGSGGFTRGGGFSVSQIMSGCNNTYTGVTNINGGIITVDCLANGSLASGIGASSSASSNLLFNTGILRYTGGSVSIDRGFTSQSGVAAIEVTNAATTLGFSGTVLGGAGVRKDGPGTLVLSGNNTYSGGTHVTGGILRAGSATAFGTGQLDMNNTAGATLDLNGFNAAFAWIAGGGTTGGNINLGAQTLTIGTGNGNITSGVVYAGNISGTGNLVKNGAQYQRLSGCNSTYTGTTTINGGVLSVDCLANGGSNSAIGASSAAAGNLVIGGGAALSYTGPSQSSDRLFTVGVGGGTLDASGTGALNLTNTGAIALSGTNTARTFTLSGTNTGDNTLAAQLDNNGTGVSSLTKTGTGTWILTNNNSSYTGVTTISGGVLGVSQLANGGAASGIGASSSAASNLVIGNGSTLRYTGAGDSTDRLFTLASGVTFIESSGTGAVDFTNTGTIGLANPNVARTIALGGTNTGNNTLAGIIGNAGTGITTLAKNDSGTWALTGNNTYTGNTVVNNGNLMIGNGGTSGNLGTGNVIVDSPTSTLSMNRSDTVVFNAIMSGPGTFAQVGTGTTTLTANNSIGATTVSAGTLDVNGILNTSTLAMSGTSTLNVDGTVQAAGAAPTLLSGDVGASTINVNSGGILRGNGDLGDGGDAVNVSGTLDTGAAVLNLGAGDDTLTLNDGAAIVGAGIDAGAGSADNLAINNALPLSFGGTGFAGFERLTKQNTGVLTLTGSQSYSAGTAIDGGTVDVDGTLDTSAVSMADGTTLNIDGSVQAAGPAPTALTGSAGVNTILVNAGASLSANGDLGDGSDTLTLAGALNTGAAALSLGAGSDTLTLNDGATIGGIGVDGGSGANDQLVLDNASPLSFDGATTAGFESLLKQNTGIATMTGSQSFSAGTTIAGGVLDVDGSLTTPTIALADDTALSVDGSVQAGVGTAATITGSAGVNSVFVGAGASLLASGDLGDGADVVDVAGTLDTGGGTFALGAGDDTLTIHDGTTITGTISAGIGNDTFNTDIATSADLGAVQGFETLSKTGVGTLNINGPASSDFTTIDVAAGTLNVTPSGSVVPAPGNTLTTTVATGATLNVDGSYGCGADNDSMTISGTVSGSGTIDLCGGDDTLTLKDGSLLSAAISGGTGTGDNVVLDNLNAMIFDAGNTANFELLQKNNVGEATLVGTQSFSGGTTVDGGALRVAGALETPTLSLADGTALNVDGSVQAGVGTAVAITGSTGTNTVTVSAGGSLLANGDLGDGSDLLDVAGTLDTGFGSFDLGAGDDTLTIHDGTNIIGTVIAGAGNDTFNTDIATSANLGAVQGFETLSKTGVGTLNVNGPASSDFTTVNVVAGSLNVTAAGSVIAAPGNTLTTTVASGATLNVDGSYSGGALADSFTVSGTVSGSGTIGLAGGDDTLMLNDGAVLNNVIDGGGHGAGDTVVLNNAAALSFDGGDTVNFEFLRKDNVGEATLTGAQSFSGGTTLNGGTLSVAGALETPTVALADGTVLNVGGSLQAAGGTTATLTGSAGVNTVNVAAGASLLASGDLGDGSDLLDVSGTLDTGAGILDLGAGDDSLTIHDGTDIVGTVAGGVGIDNVNANIALSADLGAVQGFETLSKTGVGTLNVNGPASSDFITVDVLAGTLNVAATGAVVAQNTTIASGTTLQVDGSYSGTSGSDSFIVAGSVAGAGTLDLLDGDDSFTIQDGADLSGLSNAVDGGAGTDTFIADLAGSATLGGAINFETLTKTNTGTLNVDGPAASAFTTVNVNGGTLDIGAAGSIDGAVTTTVAGGAILNVDGTYTGSAGADTMNVSGTVAGSGTIDLAAGDDTLTLNDGALLNNVIDGGGHGTGDTVVLNNAGALSFDAGNTVNFEFLQKDNAGTATLTGTQSFSGGTTLNGGTLSVAGALETPTVALADGTALNVGGSLQAAGGTTATLTGSAGANTVNVAAGASLLATGDLGDGSDILDVSGTLDTQGGVFDLGAGDDTLTIHDGTNLIGTVAAGVGNDTFNTDIATLANLGAVQGFETLSKTGIGTLNINGPASSDFTTVNVAAGTLNVTAGGSVAAQTTTVAAGSTLQMDGSYSGTTGNDSFTVAGTVAGAGTLDLLDGDDSFTIQDGADLSGLSNAIDGGAGIDTFVADLAGNATLGGAINFETLTKTNTGTLNIDGPAASAFTTVNVNGGTLDIGAAGSIDGAVTSTVASGATLNADGSYTGSAGADTMNVSGTVAGSGTIGLAAGDDTLTLNDGALLNNVIDGGGHGAGDTVLLNNAGALSFDAGNTVNFEFLQKDNVGTATLTGTQSFSGGTTLNGGELAVGGTLSTPTVAMNDDTTLTVDGSLDAGAGIAAAITGSAGINTVTINGSALADGDLGAGEDVLDVVGTLDMVGGTFALGDGDDSFIVHDGTTVLGTIDGGAGLDTRVYDINLSANLGSLASFEGVTKTGTGVLNVTGPGATDLQEVSVLDGVLNIGPAGSVVATAGSSLTTVVATGATLNVDGSFGCGADNDSMTVSGTVSGSGSIDLCGGEDTLTLGDGAVLNATVSGGSHGSGDTVVLDNANAFAFDASRTTNFEFLQKDNAGEATLTGTQSFSGGTALNGGILSVAGTLQTPTLAMADGTTLAIDGRVQGMAAGQTVLTGSAGVNTVEVAAGASLLASGDLGDGDDVFDLAGTLDTGSGIFALGSGDDRFIVHETTAAQGTVEGGLGNDTLEANIGAGFNVPLGSMLGFESLAKSGAGALQINGPSAFIDVEVIGGLLEVTAAGSVSAQNTTVAASATLKAAGLYSGTAGNDSFASSGTVIGNFEFGAGNDSADFRGGELSGLTRFDGGAGGEDRVNFHGMTLDQSDVGALSNWERVDLLTGTHLTLNAPLNLAGGLLSIDGTSELIAMSGANLTGSVANSGVITVGGARFGISGNYTGGGALALTVSPGNQTSGGLDIGGDVAGTTAVTFLGDGSETPQQPASIRVISAPNDNAATAGSFTAAGASDGVVRLNGSVFPWTFDRQGDGWYLNTEASDILPEIGGYAVLPDIGLADIQSSNRLLFERMSGVRGDTPRCGAEEEGARRAYTSLRGDCHGFWVAASGSELEMGANPGFAFSGDTLGLYVGIDVLLQDRETRSFRGGVFLGYQHGNYWADGANSTDLQGIGQAHVRVDTPMVGMYGSVSWQGGTYLDMTLVGQRPEARVAVADGFNQDIGGSSVTASAQFGHRFSLSNGWTVEPQLQLSASAMQWQDQRDASGKQLVMDDDLLGTVRAAVRAEKRFETAGGARIRPWATLGLQDTLGEKDDALLVVPIGSGTQPQAFPNHELGLMATVDVGVEAELNESVSLFGVLSYGESLEGSDVKQRQANLGVRIRW
ncbi:autotransporter-associated beta strand repeat-containing protein [Lysobacter sp. Hz 25]|uniref:autotransporter-associated beta strand repeat-containing protein n=1 Tax=Lysobacter sp. Hz 25 TaxID=3383698 RepID=UPI0038D46A9E